MRWRRRDALLGGLLLLIAACGSTDAQSASTSTPSATSSESINSVATTSTETVDPTISAAESSVLRLAPAPDISADLEQPLCRDLAPLLDALVEAPLVPVGARMVGAPDVGCEILFPVPSYSPKVVIGRIPEPTSEWNEYLLSQRTDDGDEASVHWNTGSVACIHPTGADLLSLSDAAHVVVQRVDGSRLYVATYGQDDESVAVGIAQVLDNRLG